MTTPTPYVHAGSLRTCARCLRERMWIAARGLCGGCYWYVRKHHEVDQYPRVRGAA